MLTHIHPKLPMRSKQKTEDYYIRQLGFEKIGGDYPEYLMVRKDMIEIHFFLFEELDALHNYGQVYIRVEDIKEYYQQLVDAGVAIHPNGTLTMKPWGMWEFSLLDADHNLLTFGEML